MSTIQREQREYSVNPEFDVQLRSLISPDIMAFSTTCWTAVEVLVCQERITHSKPWSSKQCASTQFFGAPSTLCSAIPSIMPLFTSAAVPSLNHVRQFRIRTRFRGPCRLKQAQIHAYTHGTHSQTWDSEDTKLAPGAGTLSKIRSRSSCAIESHSCPSTSSTYSSDTSPSNKHWYLRVFM